VELSRRAWEDHDDAPVEVENESGCGSGEAEGDRALGTRRLLAHSRREVLVGTAQALRDHPRDRADLLLELDVEHERAPCDLRHQFDGTVVVRRSETARHEAEVRLESLAEGMLEVWHAVADDEDGGRLEPEPNGLGREERPVPIVSLAADELGSRRDDGRPGAAQEGARTILRDVTTKVVPRGSSTLFPLRRTTTFCGLASATWRLFASKDFRWPCSSVPL
jgi:hypothetical protein